MEWVTLAAIAVPGAVTALSVWLTHRGVALGRGHIEQLRDKDWAHGRVSRQRLAYVDGLREGLMALERGHDERRSEFAAATAHIELYASDDVMTRWRAFVDALTGQDRPSALLAFEAFTGAARHDDQGTL